MSTVRAVWDRIRPTGLVDILVWLVTAASLVYLLVLTDGQLLEVTVWAVPFVLVIALVSLPWRTIAARHLVTFFLIGVGPVFLLAVLSQGALGATPLDGWTADLVDSLGVHHLQRDVWAPVTEELLKIVPLLVALWWRAPGLRATAGPIDVGLMAGATGAGMGFSEDILVFIEQGLASPPGSSWALGLGRFYEGLVGAEPFSPLQPGLLGIVPRSTFAENMSFFLPGVEAKSGGMIWPGHGGLALGVGLAIGLALHARRRLNRRRFLVLPVVALSWATFEHATSNWRGSGACLSGTSPLCTLSDFDLGGRLYPIVVLVAFGLAIVAAHQVGDQLRASDPGLWPDRARVDRASYGPAVAGRLRWARDELDLVRWRRKTAFGGFRLAAMGRVPRRDVLTVMTCRIVALQTLERLTGAPESTLPERTRSLVAWARPIS